MCVYVYMHIYIYIFFFFFCRVQRCAMLQFSEFHEKLLNTLCRKADDGQITEHAQSLVLDILCWLAGVHSNGPGRLIRFYLPQIALWMLWLEVQHEPKRLLLFCSSKEGNESLLSKTRKCLSDIVRVCFFEAGRSIAHKCARFLALCIRLVIFKSKIYFVGAPVVWQVIPCV